MLSWQQTLNGVEIAGHGNQTLLEVPLTAFFASRQCPGSAIRVTMDWALKCARAQEPVISGFHSPLEQSVLKILMAAASPVVVVLARPLERAKLPGEWAGSVAHGCMAVVSANPTAERMTEEVAAARNGTVAKLAASIIVAYASPEGALDGLRKQWQADGRQISILAGA